MVEERTRLDREIAYLAHSIVSMEKGVGEPEEGEAIGIIAGAELVFETYADEPMPVRVLADRMEAVGVVSTSKRFKSAVYASLYASPRFIRLKDGRWCRRSAAPEADIKRWSRHQRVKWSQSKKGGSPKR